MIKIFAEKLVLNTAEGTHFIPIADVFLFKSTQNYTTIETTKGEKIVVSVNLGQFDHLTASDELEGSAAPLFFKIHKSHIVRLSMVRHVLKMSDGEYVVLENGAKLPLARRRREAFLAVMSG